ncbi:MAG TPA: adenylate/guanylate cyclase domain-containing protein [Rhizomicrobium sp.]|nr:adenylate/guanylate cyclase domain-containing protein [Rhizomicrobium sp.]
MKPRPIAIWALPLAVLVAAMVLAATDAGGLATRIHNIQYDSYQYLHPRPYQDTLARANLAVRTLDADSASLAKFGPWPWSSAVLARLTNELKDAGAAIVVFDMPLATPDPASPERLAAGLPAGPTHDAARAALASLPKPDDSLIAAMATIRSVTGFTLGSEAGASPPALKSTPIIDGDARALNAVAKFDDAIAALPDIEKASAGIGALNLPADTDGNVRAVPLILKLGDKIVPSIDAEVMRLATTQAAITLQSRGGPVPVLDSGPRFVTALSGLLKVPLRANGSVRIHFSGNNAARHISAAALDDGTIDKARLKNAIVYIAGPGDIVQTSTGPRNAAAVHAEAMEAMLLGAVLKPANAMPAELVLMIIAGLGLIAILVRAGALWAGLFTLVVIVAVQSFTWAMFTSTQLLLDSSNASLALALTFFAGLSARSIEIVRRRSQLRGAFSNALAPEILDRIAHKPQLLNLDGETRNVSYLTCGIRRYSALAQSFSEDPVGFTKLLRAALTPMVREVLNQGGTIDTYNGEGFSAFWNAPLDDPEHAIHACEAANKMTIALAQVNEQLSRERRLDGTAFEPIEIGIAISTGPAICGGFGGQGRTGYSVTGECCLVAKKVRDLSAQYGPAVVVSDDTRKAAERGFAFLEVDFIACMPGNGPIKLHAMLGNPLMRASPKFRALATFHEHIFQSIQTRQWAKARELIEQCRKLSGASQKMYDLHLARVAYFEANPPGDDWDGAFRPILQ